VMINIHLSDDRSSSISKLYIHSHHMPSWWTQGRYQRTHFTFIVQFQDKHLYRINLTPVPWTCRQKVTWKS
jgi:hypothetical protein